MLKHTVKIGAVGWQHENWDQDYYPDDLPADWKLDYYANELNCVLLKADLWQSASEDEIENWNDSIHEYFQFCLEMPTVKVEKAIIEKQLSCFESPVWLFGDNCLETTKAITFKPKSHPSQILWQSGHKIIWQLDIDGMNGREFKEQVELLDPELFEGQVCVILSGQKQQQIVEFRMIMEMMGRA